jgi:ADP-ribosylglycohydrolase
MTLKGLKDRYIATMVLHALGDTIGFKNGDWEFNYNNVRTDPRLTLEIIFEFIALGGVNDIDLSDWYVSDDTILHMAIAKSLVDKRVTFYKSNDKIKDSLTRDQEVLIKNNISKALRKLIKSSKVNRAFGKVSLNSILSWDDKKDARNTSYDPMSGGNGCTMRTLCVGLAFHKKEDLDKLIDFSITTSRFTHNSPLGFLGGFASAYFVSLAINNVDMYTWPFKLLELLESEKIRNYINMNKFDVFSDYHNFIKKWKKYLDERFNKKKLIHSKIYTNLIYRSGVFFKSFIDKSDEKNKKFIEDVIGADGAVSLIMAYDGLLECSGNWEKLIYYTMLHCGDSDTVGAIAGGLYGSVYGFGNVPENMMKYLESKKELISLGEKIFDKYS